MPVREEFLGDRGDEAALMSSSSAVLALTSVCLCLFFSYQDLGSSDGPPRNWKGIGIAVVVILAVMSLVTLSVILLTPGKNNCLEEKKLQRRAVF